MVREEYNHSRPVSALIRDWLLHNKGGGGGGILKTVTGNPISISDALAARIKSLSVSLSPIQDLHGQDAPYPAGGGKNLMAPIAYSGGRYNLNIGTVLELTKAEPQPTVNGNTITYTAEAWGGFTFKTNPLSAGAYVVHADVTNTPSRRLTFYVVGSSDNVIKQKTASYNTDIENRTYTVEDGDYIAFFCGISPGGTVTLKDLQTEAGAFTSRSPYENICPISGRDSVTVTRTGKNLFNKTTVTPTRFVSADGTLAYSANYAASDYIPVKAGVSMIVSGLTASSAAIKTAFYDREKVFISAVSQNKPTYSFTVPSGAEYARITVPNADLDTAQLEIGSTATAYEPYDGASVTVQLGDTVYGGNAEIISGSGESTYGMVDLGTLSWSINMNGNNTIEVASRDLASVKAKGITNLICNMLPTLNQSSATDDGRFGIRGFASGGGIAVKIPKTVVSDTEGAIAWIQSNHPMACYELAQPTALTVAPATMSTLKGDNNVWSDGDSVEMTYKAVSS